MPTRSRPLMDISELAEYLGVSVRHIRRLVAERRIPYDPQPSANTGLQA